MTSYVLIYGPPNSGKTLNAIALAAHYKCSLVVDDWNPRMPTPDPDGRCILLLARTSSAAGLEGHEVRCIPIGAAKMALGNNWIEPRDSRVLEEIEGEDPVDSDLDALAMVAVQWHRNRLAGRRPKAVRNTFLAAVADFRRKEAAS